MKNYLASSYLRKKILVDSLCIKTIVTWMIWTSILKNMNCVSTSQVQVDYGLSKKY